jgi:hypothetical protein
MDRGRHGEHFGEDRKRTDRVVEEVFSEMGDRAAQKEAEDFGNPEPGGRFLRRGDKEGR